MTDLQKQDFAQTLARGLRCLETLSETSVPLSCTETAVAMHVSRAAARRILLTLQNLGYVSEIKGYFSLAPKVLSLGSAMLGSGSVWSYASKYVVEVADKLNEPCSISVLDEFSIVFMCRDATRRIYTSRLGVGDRLPAYCSASGKLLLALLPQEEFEARLARAHLSKKGPRSITDPEELKAALTEVRSCGHAMAIDEMEMGTVAVAIPLRDRAERVVAAMSVASDRSRMSPKQMEMKVLPALKVAGKNVEKIIKNFQDRGRNVF